MPVYDYVCGDCGAEHDIVHGFDEKRKKCPTCGKLKLKRAWSQVAAFHQTYSPMHPRAGRGVGITGKRKKKDQ